MELLGNLLSWLAAGPRVTQPLIKYCDKAKRHVKGSSFHGLWYVGELEIWAGFENEVGKNFIQH